MLSSVLDLAAVCKHFNVSRETFERLHIYSQALQKWNPTINLVSKSTLDSAAVRHFADSMQLWQHRKEFQSWVDIGSGAGFPGLVLAILAAEQSLGSDFHLVESDARKSAFLRNVSRETGVKVIVHTMRIEDFDAVEADIVSARALAPLSDLLEMSKTFLKKDGICLYLKGQNCQTEIGGASRFWTFEAEQFASETDVNGTVLRVKEIERVRT
ncbi:16S rRNA (guanine(527)-N(7))-methyltransferase RsmG [Neptunicoccus cionae]|uniref:Ribosomal RNA small subunit methyltransferase G n=1 Tax=Neptunicoccus cionae TaxID=2035344 RepID=A0A916QXF1_9RHOB|nr:16S rRNA (guanine(527)-N(7))-methyltransferase RsmG [Amylibacter cionae]GGA18763.1 ribosomal RNA small subunit methyltransferase G [Amylibacter cionae]